MDIWENKRVIVFGICLDLAHKNLPLLFKHVVGKMYHKTVVITKVIKECYKFYLKATG